MNDCLNNIVTLGICPDEGTSLSGFTLMQAPGITPKGLDSIASETYVQGTNMAMAKKALAISLVRNDFIGALQSNGVTVYLDESPITTGTFNPFMPVVASTAERGVTLHKVQGRGNSSIKRTLIREIQVYPLDSGDASLKIIQGASVLVYSVSLVAGQLNVFGADELGGFPYNIPDGNAAVRIVLSAPGIRFASSSLTCLKGCNRSIPNPCGWVDGWDGTRAVKTEGFGINIVFNCRCDYEQMLCNMATSYSGELIWLKWRIAVMEERQSSSRFNDFIVYERAELAERIAELRDLYAQKWNELMSNMPGLLRAYQGECIDCRRTKFVTNL